MKIYKQRVEEGGVFCAHTEESLQNILDDLKHSMTGDVMYIETCEMTEEEFENLGEFEGF